MGNAPTSDEFFEYCSKAKRFTETFIKNLFTSTNNSNNDDYIENALSCDQHGADDGLVVLAKNIL